MIEDFCAIDLDEFRKKYLFEGRSDSIDSQRLKNSVGGGKLTQQINKLNADITDQLKMWATRIHNRINSYLMGVKRKNPDINVNVRDIMMEEAAIIIIDINKTSTMRKHVEIKISIFDDDQILVKMPDIIAGIVNRGINLKYFDNKSKVAGFVINILERIL